MILFIKIETMVINTTIIYGVKGDEIVKYITDILESLYEDFDNPDITNLEDLGEALEKKYNYDGTTIIYRNGEFTVGVPKRYEPCMIFTWGMNYYFGKMIMSECDDCDTKIDPNELEWEINEVKPYLHVEISG